MTKQHKGRESLPSEQRIEVNLLSGGWHRCLIKGMRQSCDMFHPHLFSPPTSPSPHSAKPRTFLELMVSKSWLVFGIKKISKIHSWWINQFRPYFRKTSGKNPLTPKRKKLKNGPLFILDMFYDNCWCIVLSMVTKVKRGRCLFKSLMLISMTFIQKVQARCSFQCYVQSEE